MTTRIELAQELAGAGRQDVSSVLKTALDHDREHLAALGGATRH